MIMEIESSQEADGWAGPIQSVHFYYADKKNYSRFDRVLIR